MSSISIDESAEAPQFGGSMQTTKTDVYSSAMFAGIVMLGVGVVMLGTLFILNLPRGETVTPIIIEPTAEGTINPPGLERDIEPPAPEEVQELTEPTMEETLVSVTDSITASLDLGVVGASGAGDARRAGQPGEGEDIIPRYERWELKFTARDMNGYAKQLEHFNIELGAIGGGKELVDYVSKVGSTPTKRSGKGDLEERIYFMFRTEGQLLQYDRALLKKGGVSTDGRTILKFLSKDLENQLAGIELDFARKAKGPMTDALDLAHTTFEVQSVSGKGYQFIVVDQRYRKPNRKK